MQNLCQTTTSFNPLHHHTLPISNQNSEFQSLRAKSELAFSISRFAMDDFNTDCFKFEKSTAMARFRRLFRFVELFAAVALLTWLSSRAPVAVKASGDYLRRLSAAAASPIFVFFLGNAIVVTLFAKSGHLTRSSGESESEISEVLTSNLPAEEKEIVFQDKETIICEEVAKRDSPEENAVENRNPRVSDSDPPHLRLYQITESETYDDILRRLETDVCRKAFNVRKSEGDEDLEDNVSNEEFRRTIEEFIAKQVKFLREESHSVVVHSQDYRINV